MCRGGDNLLYLLCLISNTMPQLEQSSLQPSTDLQHRHLQTTSYNHLLLHLISRKGKRKQQQARNPLAGGLRSQKGLRPFNTLQSISKSHRNISRLKIMVRCSILPHTTIHLKNASEGLL